MGRWTFRRDGASRVGLAPAALAAALGLAFAADALARVEASPPAQRSVIDACAWDRPGHNPFSGDVVAAVDHYADIPAAVRERLKARMETRQYDEIVSIRRDRIEGRATYAPALSEMHFGRGRVCRTVTRSGWSDAMEERGLVYCEAGHCVIVPTVCRNVSRVTRLGPPREAPPPLAVASGEAPLAFEPPQAGPTEAPAAAGTPFSAPVAAAEPPLAAAPLTFVDAAFPRGPGGLPQGGGGGSGWWPPAPPPPPIPEPQTALLMLGGLAGLVAFVRRRSPSSRRPD